MATQKGQLPQTIGTTRAIAQVRQYKYLAIVSSIVYGMIYSFAVGIIAHYSGVRIGDYTPVPCYDLDLRSLGLFEPYFVAYPNDYIAIFAPW